jgi:hypothetical protein
MNTIIRRIAAGTVLAAAPALIAVGVATGASASTGITTSSPDISQSAPQQSATPTHPHTGQRQGNLHHGHHRHPQFR